jgi:signal transduction histidine kinase
MLASPAGARLPEQPKTRRTRHGRRRTGQGSLQVMKLNLRAKGIVAFLALTAYVVLVGMLLGAERQKLLRTSIELEDIYVHESELARVEYAVHHSLLRLQAFLFDENLDPALADDVALDVELVQSGLQSLQARHPGLDPDIARLGHHAREVRKNFSKAALLELRATYGFLEDRADEVASRVRQQRKAKWEEYYRVYDGMTFIAVATLIFAILVFGALLILFFTRIAWDMDKLQERAMAIVSGYRGPPLAVTRKDEVGGLMQAVNRMQSELRKHEQQLELVRQQRFHQEKMAAVGSLAAAVAHEINNPIAAIAGIAKSMATAEPGAPRGNGDFEGDGPSLILQQTERISAISRQIAELTRPPSPQPELTDLNRLVRNVCKFTGYDRRLQAVELILDLDPDMPAVECVPDHVTQVLMNLLLNSADALSGITGRRPSILVLTRLAGDELTLAVQDNGHGMDAATREHAFDEGFSTKFEGGGAGLGLFLCKSLVEGDGGRIEIVSAPGAGTTVRVRLPLHQTAIA